jgi:hypothetical protein
LVVLIHPVILFESFLIAATATAPSITNGFEEIKDKATEFNDF